MSTPEIVLIGHPVSHSVSPAIHAAAAAALSLSYQYRLLDCPDEARVRRVVESLRSGEISGVNVTVPHKRLALELADVVEPTARQAHAANVLSRGSGVVVADDTDVPALEEELADFAPAVRSALVIGAGGAALAAVCACRRRGIERVGVIARRNRTALPRTDWPNYAPISELGAEPLAWPEDDAVAFRRRAETTDLVLQATSAGMRGVGRGDDVSRVLPWDAFPASAQAYDVVYTPAVTPFLDAARRRGLRARGGLGMLIAQAAHAITIWFGRRAPREVMLEAARHALSEQGEGGIS